MANKTITQLTEEFSPTPSDLLVIHGSGLTKKIQLQNLVGAGLLGDMPPLTIKGRKEITSGPAQDLTAEEVKEILGGSYADPKKFTFTGNGTTLSFPVTGLSLSTNPNNYRVDINGILQESVRDYNVAGSNIVFNYAPPAGTKIVVVTGEVTNTVSLSGDVFLNQASVNNLTILGSISAANGSILTGGRESVSRTFYGNGTATSFAITGVTNLSNNPANYGVYISGVAQEPNTDYSIVGSNIIFTSPPSSGDKIVVIISSVTELVPAPVIATGSTTARTLANRFADVANVKDFGAKGDGVTDDTAAIQAAVNAAIAKSGELFVPAGTYFIGTPIDIPFVGGIKISGTSCNSIGTRSLFLQKNIEQPVFSINAINVTITGLSFTTWAGNIIKPDGTPISCVSVTSNSITLNSDPWPNVTPILWNVISPQISTDGTPYSTLAQINISGSFYASSVTKNLDGTVTLNNVKGANGTPNAEIANLVGKNVNQFISLAHIAAPPLNPNAGIIYLGVKENAFYEKLWFNQVSSAFTISALGSGSGPGVGVGNLGFWSDIVCDQAAYFVKGLGDLYGLSIVNSEFYGVGVSFYAPFGGIKASNFSNCKLIIGKMFQANSNLEGLTVTGCSFNEMDSYGYSNFLINNGGIIDRCSFAGNNFGRSTNTCISTKAINASIFAGNDIISNGEGSSEPWIYILGVGSNGYVTNSYLGSNNFSNQYGSNSNRIGFVSTSPNVNGSTFGGEFIGYQSGTKIVGWVPVTSFLNGWSNVGVGTPSLQYFKDQNGVVTIYGSIVGGTNNTIVFQLPIGYRPQDAVNRFAGGIRWDGSNQQVMFMQIESNGNVTAYGNVVSWSQINLSFPTR